MDKTQAVAFCDYAIGERHIGGRDPGDEITTPHAPELKAFVMARLGNLTPIYGRYLHPANREPHHDAEYAPQAKAFADLLREVADAIDPPAQSDWEEYIPSLGEPEA